MAKLLELEKRGGRLFLTPTRAGRARARQLASRATDPAIKEMLSGYLGHGWTWIRPEEVGALTGAPMISDEDLRVNGSRVYWHERYAIEDPIEMWANGETVRFDGASE